MTKKRKGIERLKSRYGLIFVSPWIVGLLLFFIFPIGQSIFYSFSSTKLTSDGLITNFAKLSNYEYIINKHPLYLTALTESLSSMLYSLPAILVVSLVLAMILNRKFAGRTFFRCLFFLPVIIASGVVVDLLFSVTSSDITSVGVDASVSANMVDYSEIISKLELPEEISKYISAVMEEIFNIIWGSGVQIVLFISGLQSIPDLYYEVAKVEGCTKWEEFWFITLPLLSKVIMLVIVYTIVDLLTSKSNSLMALLVKTLSNLEYGTGAAMAWLYFLVVGFCLAVIMFFIDRLWFRRWR